VAIENRLFEVKKSSIGRCPDAGKSCKKIMRIHAPGVAPCQAAVPIDRPLVEGEKSLLVPGGANRAVRLRLMTGQLNTVVF
jgi:hypothetical protein